jgi:hypothetical protein
MRVGLAVGAWEQAGRPVRPARGLLHEEDAPDAAAGGWMSDKYLYKGN